MGGGLPIRGLTIRAVWPTPPCMGAARLTIDLDAVAAWMGFDDASEAFMFGLQTTDLTVAVPGDGLDTWYHWCGTYRHSDGLRQLFRDGA